MANKTEQKTVFADFVRKAQTKLINSKKHLTKDLIVPSLIEGDDENTGRITIRSLTPEELSECVNIEEDSKDMNTGDIYAVYMAVQSPDLRAAAKELKALGEIDRPMDVVYTLELHEITSIAREIMILTGVTSDKKVKVAENLKN